MEALYTNGEEDHVEVEFSTCTLSFTDGYNATYWNKLPHWVKTILSIRGDSVAACRNQGLASCFS